jgi:hypothetical protein
LRSVVHGDTSNDFSLPVPFQLIPANTKARGAGLATAIATSKISPKQVGTALVAAASIRRRPRRSSESTCFGPGLRDPNVRTDAVHHYPGRSRDGHAPVRRVTGQVHYFRMRRDPGTIEKVPRQTRFHLSGYHCRSWQFVRITCPVFDARKEIPAGRSWKTVMGPRVKCSFLNRPPSRNWLSCQRRI